MTAGRMKMMTPLILIILGVSGVECEVKVPHLLTPGLNFMECTGVYLTIYIFVRHWRSTMPTLILLILGVSGVYCDSHSMQYYITGVSSPGSGIPVYSVVGYVDDKEMTSYNSDTREYFPKTEWIKKLGSDYWEEETQKDRYAEPIFKHNVQTAMRRFNQTGGIHILQRMYGCELREDGTTEGYQQYGYDGREFMSLDTQRWIWIPTMNEAQITTQRWNSPDIRLGEKDQNYLEIDCIAFLKKLIDHGREDLEKRVRPEVKVWGHRQSDDVTRLHCLVYGFHPRPVDVKWVRNGEDHIPSDEMTQILPHPDGTYQIRISVKVPTRKGDTYSCHVDHSSLEEIMIVNWERFQIYGVNLDVRIGLVLAVFLIGISAAALVCFFLRKLQMTTLMPSASNNQNI